MLTSSLSELWAKSGLVWLLATMSFGMYLGMSGQFGMSSAHAHAGLLGGVLGIALSYLFSRPAGDTRIGAGFVQWLIYNLAVATQATGLWFVINGNLAFVPMIVIGGSVLVLTLLWIALTIWPKLRRPPTV
ncbi:MAG: hypothetical protein ABR601_03455 [Parasphingopyxis sp.]